MRKIMHLLLAGYHRGVSPVLPNACRFYPSCSVYAAQAVEKHGVAKGLWLGLRRLSRCNPWNLGGYDPPV
jgi:putative membrane protein insertion efficiency factor